MNDLNIPIPTGKKAYFASDFHLGLGTDYPLKGLEREKRIVCWLESVKRDCEVLFLMGDLFDFWFEYKQTIPKGHTRFLGKLAELSDAGIGLHIFPGNHDMWMFDYLAKELGATIHKDPVKALIGNKTFLLGHGDGLGPGDHLYKILKKIFRNTIARFMFRWLHPDIGVRLARIWSRNSRLNKEGKGETFKGNSEYLVQYCKQIEKIMHFDYYIFGHRHLPLKVAIEKGSYYYNLGEWIHACTYGVFDGNSMRLEQFEKRT